jgi:hypothetical protein
MWPMLVAPYGQYSELNPLHIRLALIAPLS